MRTTGANGVGRFSVVFEVVNHEDLIRARHGDLPPGDVRRMTITGVPDSGATKFVLPKKVVEQLGLRVSDPVKVRYADGRVAKRATAEGAYLEFFGRHGVFTAIVEPKREDALIGAIVLEDLDLLVDANGERLIPRDPQYAIYEID